MDTIGAKIQQARREAGFKNAAQFSVALDVSFSSVQRWEQGKTTPSIVRLLAISQLTGKPLSWFLADEEAAVA